MGKKSQEKNFFRICTFQKFGVTLHRFWEITLANTRTLKELQ